MDEQHKNNLVITLNSADGSDQRERRGFGEVSEAETRSTRTLLTPEMVEALQQGENLLNEPSDEEKPSYISTRRPRADVFFRIHPHDSYVLPNIGIFTATHDDVPRLVLGLAQRLLGPRIAKPRNLYLCLDEEKKLFIWPAPIPSDGRSMNECHKSVRRAVFYARQEWIRIQWDGNQYRIFSAAVTLQEQLGEPNWPTEPFVDLLQQTFEDTIIDQADDPVIQRILGKER